MEDSARHKKLDIQIDDVVFDGQEADCGTFARLWIPVEGKGREVSGGDRGIPAVSSLSAEQAMADIDEISPIFHRWQGKDCKKYKDVKGICKFADMESVRRLRFDLSPENMFE